MGRRPLAPANYKRPMALITQGMVDQAVKTVTELGLEPALSRRLARLTDVNIIDVLWASNKADVVLNAAGISF